MIFKNGCGVGVGGSSKTSEPPLDPPLHSFGKIYPPIRFHKTIPYNLRLLGVEKMFIVKENET